MLNKVDTKREIIVSDLIKRHEAMFHLPFFLIILKMTQFN